MALLRKIIPFTKQHPWKAGLLLLLLIFLATVLITSIRDFTARKQVANSMDKLYQLFHTQGPGQAERFSDCWRLQEKTGPGAKICEENIKVTIAIDRGAPPSYPVNAEKAEIDADNKLATLSAILRSAQDFKPNNLQGGLPDRVRIYDGSTSFTRGSYTYRHTNSGTKCIANYDYNKEKLQLTLRFYCDTTSWLTRNLNI